MYTSNKKSRDQNIYEIFFLSFTYNHPPKKVNKAKAGPKTHTYKAMDKRISTGRLKSGGPPKEADTN